MKKNKILLITEINSINRIMGNKLLLEPWHLLLDDAIKAAKSLSIRRSGKLSKNFDNFISAAEVAAKNGDEADFLLNLKKAADESKEFSEYLRPKVLSSIDPSQKKILDDFYDDIISDVNSGKASKNSALSSIDKGVDATIGGPFDEVRDLLKKEYRDKLTKNIPQTKSVVKSQITTGLKEGWKNSKSVYGEILGRTWDKYITRNYKGPFWNESLGKRFLMWLGTGSTRLPSELVDLYRNNGLLGVTSTYVGEAGKRWLKLTVVMTLVHTILDIAKDSASPFEAEKQGGLVKIAWERLKEGWAPANIGWVIPIIYLKDPMLAVLVPLLSGDPGHIVPNLEKWLDTAKNEAENLKEKTKEEAEEFRKKAVVPKLPGKTQDSGGL